ncbi:MAG: beta galactosidase jelly roll domain-containing protein [Lachnospiraceae bacterium]|nr:beta galactosidase jelly roll domain-containing protein [Lachnospiraceae bacterium]
MNITLPSIISSGMVIEKHARIWGKAKDLKSITIIFNGNEITAPVTDEKWEVFLDTPDFGGPYEMQIEDIILTDIYVGYVFLLCGQSNMETPASRVRIKYEEDFKNLAHTPEIRIFQIGKGHSFVKAKDNCNGIWRAKSPETIDNTYAMTFYLSEFLKSDLDAPLGFIECAVGGSRIEAWLSENSVRYMGYASELLRLFRYDGFIERLIESDEERMNIWYKNTNDADSGIKENWHEPEYIPNGWKSRKLTTPWAEDIGLLNGVVWFRKDFLLDTKIAGQPGRIFLGTITDSDIVFLNGEIIGRTDYKYPPRVYPIREGLLKEGKNTLVIRVTSEREYGGFTADKDYYIETSTGDVDISDEWLYCIGYAGAELAPATQFTLYPCSLYNAMLYPVMSFSISAFLWYQGESNDGFPYLYDMLLSRFITDIRASFGDIPFISVQLPNYDAGEFNENWAIIREKQASVLNYRSTALIITNDIGEDNDLHPLNKRDVAKRMTAAILYYLKNIEFQNDKVLLSIFP